MTADRPLIGFVFVLLFCILAPVGDALAKLVGTAAPLMVLLLSRFVCQALLLAPIVLLRRHGLPQNRRVIGLIVTRSAFHIIGIGAMFLSLRLLPLADAIAIVFVFPFILLFLGHFILGEQVGPRRIGACLFGFAGTLLVIQPSFVEIGAAALLPVLVAFAFSLFMLITRSIAKSADPICIQALGGAVSSLILAVIWAFAGQDTHFDLSIIVPDDLKILSLLLGIGVLGTVAHLFMTMALRFAPSATIAPLQYLEIPIATIIGWLVFHELPDGIAAIGISITIGAGIFVLMNERSRRKPEMAE